MKLRKLTISDYFLIIVNLIPVYGVWFEGWNAAQIFLVFCLETVIIGVFNIVKMACVTLFVKPKDVWNSEGTITKVSGLFFIIFFTVHYGFFVFIQTQIFFSVSGILENKSFFSSYRDIPRALGSDGQLVLLIFIVYYTLQTFYDFFLSGEYKTISMGKLMFQPYGRIFIQQFVVIAGAVFIAMGLNTIFIMILVFVKLGFDLFINFDDFLNKAELKEKEKMNMLEKTNTDQLKS
ncbi:MAG: hypothetical protein IPL84_10395 [Chitinophagaceae bacterium]|nr:hypothetical protein [Chitinophagaceae bacterium]